VAPPPAYLAFVRAKRREFCVMTGAVAVAAVTAAATVAAARGHADYDTVVSIVSYNLAGTGLGMLVSSFA